MEKFKGLHLPDPISDILSNRIGFKKATRSSHYLHTEMDTFRGFLFPDKRKYNHERSSYTLSDEYFKFHGANESDNELISNYFLKNSYHHPDYGSYHSLSGMLSSTTYDLLTHGKAYYAVEWATLEIGHTNIYLPQSFIWMNPSTVKEKVANGIKRYKITYHWLTRALSTYYKYVNRDFLAHEVFALSNSLDRSTPVKDALPYLSVFDDTNTFHLRYAEALAVRDGNHLDLVRARHTNPRLVSRVSQITRTRVRRIFSLPIEGNSSYVTDFYDMYAYIQFRKRLNDMRDYIIRGFNEQLLCCIKIGDQTYPIKISVEGFTDNHAIDENYEKYKAHELTAEQLLEVIKDAEEIPSS